MDEASGIAHSKESVEEWQSLVHVCQRWRSIVFGSPRRLNLRLGCTPKTPVRDLLDIWPALPLFVWGDTNHPSESVDNIAAVLERRDRVRHIYLPSPYLVKFSATMQVPFPELTVLELRSNGEWMPILPDSFLGGSAPHLQSLMLNGIPFPALPKLLLSATHLTFLRLYGIPHSGYFPPQAMAAALSSLTSLEFLLLRFQSSSLPDWTSRCRPPPTRSVLPFLTHFYFKGVSEYLDDIVAGIDTPRLNHLSVSILNQIEFDTPQLIQLIGRTPAFEAFKRARLFFENDQARIELFSQTPGSGVLNVDILCSVTGWFISLGVCTSCLPLSMLEDLYISESRYSHLHQPDNAENSLWLDLLHPFTSVMNLYLSRRVAPRISLALQELVGARTVEVLPTLQNIFLEEFPPPGHVQEGIGQFVATRQGAGHPISVSRWENRSRF